MTIRHLLTHVSGLPDQLPENDEPRRGHAPLSEFVDRAIRTLVDKTVLQPLGMAH